MEALLWILLPGFVAIASGLLAWFIMQSRMDVALAQQREQLAEARGVLTAEKAAVKASFDTAMHAAEESARRKAFEGFLGDLRVEQRHYTREKPPPHAKPQEPGFAGAHVLPQYSAFGLDRTRDPAR